MKKRNDQIPSWILSRRNFLFGSLAALGMSGCKNITRRAQSPEENSFLALNEPTPGDTRYIGEVTGVWGMNVANVEGIGLAGQLHSTGSNPVPGWQLDHLTKELKTREEIENPKSLLADDDTSMVMVKGYMPPGIRKGENFDLEVRTHPKSDTNSLFDGRVHSTRMRTLAVFNKRVREGHVLGVGQGGILIDSLFESRQDQSNHVRGWIPGGGIALEDRPLGLTIRADGNTFKMATQIASAINDRFTTIENHGRIGVATAKTDKLINLLVPEEYRHNVNRFVVIVRNIAFGETIDKRVERLSQLEQELADPTMCGTAAARLEAMGEEGIPALTRGLRHSDLEVRFHSAMALAYIGDHSGVEQLRETAEVEPAFRWHALTSLASIEHTSAADALKELMHVDSAETRYGAFRSLKARSPHDAAVQGDWLSDDFYFHVVPSKTAPMLHLSRTKMPEMVLFGEVQEVSDNILYVETGLTVKGDGKGRVKIIRYLPGQDEIRKSSSTQLAELIPTLANLGCSYSTLIRLLRDAKKNEMLETRLVMDAVPKRKRRYQGREENELDAPERSNRFITGPLPDLFRPENDESDDIPRDDVAQLERLQKDKGGKQKTQFGLR